MRPRSALSLSLVRYCRIHCVGRGCALFSSAHSFVVPSGEGGGDDGVAVLRFAPRPVMRSVFSFRLYVHRSLFIRAVASRRRRFSSIQSSPLASIRRTLRSLPRCLIRFAHPSRPSSRLASRRPSRFMPSRFVSLFSSRFVLPDVPHACRPSCCRAVLFSSSRRSPPCLAVISAS